MTVKHLMTAPVKTCRANALVSEAARTMLEDNCGCLPVTDGKGHLAGILTDRDICLAVARHLDPSKTPVRDVMTARVVSCGVEDHLDRVLVEMKENRVRRIPVVDNRGVVKGLISIDDVIRNSGLASGRVPADAVVDVLRHICTAEPDLVVAR
jgi:CBS domain-containing protein